MGPVGWWDVWAGPEAVAAAASALAMWWLVGPATLGRLGGAPGGRWRWVRGLLHDEAARVARWWASRRRRGQANALRASVGQVCELLAVCLDAGRPLRAALRVVTSVISGPVADELAAVSQRIDLGVDEAQAWASLGEVPGYREVARDLARAVRSGLGLSSVLRQHAATARADASAAALARARGAGVLSVLPLTLCFLPAFLLLGIVPLFGALVLGMAG